VSRIGAKYAAIFDSGRPPLGVNMKSVSIIKIVASTTVVVAACSAALVFGLAHVQPDGRPAPDAATAMINATEATTAGRSDTSPAATETPPERTAIQVPPALAAAETDIAALTAELAGPPDATGKDPSSPSFDIARVEANGDAIIAGRAAPGATVDLMRGGERLDRAVANASGEFAMIPPRLPAGSYELTLSAKSPDGAVTQSKHGAAVKVSDAAPSARAAQSRAEYVPEAAPQPRPSSEPRSQMGKPQESAGLQPRAVPATSASNEAVRHAVSSKVISRGDSLWRISRVTYGDGSRYALLYRANRDRIRDPNLIYPGQTLVLPAKRN
jgi:nucleoid-associated protein YgaU